jgi:hypothetical protein
LTRATLEIDNNNQSADFVLQILPTDGNGVPVDSPLASATVPNASVPVGGVTLDVTFSPAAPVVAGHLYALAIARTGGLLFSYSPHFRNNNPCGGGSAFFSSGPGAAWAPETTPNIDFIFQTFVDPSLFKFGQGSVFSLVSKKGRLFAKVPGPGKLVVDDAKKPRRGILKHTKTRARKKGLVLLHIELTKRAIRRALRTRKLDGVGAVTYTPRGGAPSTLTFRIRLRL